MPGKSDQKQKTPQESFDEILLSIGQGSEVDGNTVQRLQKLLAGNRLSDPDEKLLSVIGKISDKAMRESLAPVCTRKGYIKSLKSLLTQNPTVNANYLKLHRPLLWHAIGVDYPENVSAIVELLVNHGADINQYADGGYTALSYAINVGNGTNIDAIQALINAGADVDKPSEIPSYI
jgi:ankyrin repeat protein